MSRAAVRLALTTVLLSVMATVAAPPTADAVFGTGCFICPGCQELSGEAIYDGYQQCNANYRFYVIEEGQVTEYVFCRAWTPCLRNWIDA